MVAETQSPLGGSASSPRTAPEVAMGRRGGAAGGRRAGVGTLRVHRRSGHGLGSLRSLHCTPVPLNQASTTCLLSHQACAPPGPTPVGLGDLTGREDRARREGRSYSFSAAETGQRPDRLYPEPRSSQQSKVRAPGRGGGKAPPEARLTRGRAGRPTSRRPRHHPADTDGGEPAGGGWPSSPNGLLSPHA